MGATVGTDDGGEDGSVRGFESVLEGSGDGPGGGS